MLFSLTSAEIVLLLPFIHICIYANNQRSVVQPLLEAVIEKEHVICL